MTVKSSPRSQRRLRKGEGPFILGEGYDPQCSGEGQSLLNNGEKDAMPGSKRLKVLVVDDNHDYADILAAHLRRQGFMVRVAYTCQTPSDIEDFNPDVVLLGVSLPTEKGLSCCKKLKTNRPNQRIIGITGCQMDGELYGQAVESGFDYLLQKPVDAARVGELVKS